MFDLTKALTSKPNSIIENPNGIAPCTLYYQTTECVELVQEVFRFEGWNDPSCIKQTHEIGKAASVQSSQIVLLELNESADVVEDAKEFASKLPTQKGVVVIGREDAISTLRALKEMGFYYVFWPVNKQEFADFLTHVNKNLKTFSGVSQKRKAKRVAVVGAKGGTGTTFLATEISCLLAQQGTDTILVDHQYSHSNIDVMLALKNFQPRKIDEFTTPLHEMDEDAALTFLHSSRKHLRLLSITGEMEQTDVLNYGQTLCDLLSRNTNFIVEDFSGSVDFRIEPQMLVSNFDVIIIVLDASISSVRNAKKLYEKIDNLQMTLSQRTRVITVVNFHRPEASFVLKKEEFQKYLGHEPNLYIGYCKQLAHLIIDGKRGYKQDRHLGRALETLLKLINGQSREDGGLGKWLKRARKA